ncbi:MAG: ABC transporter substrate-binding protein [Rhodospirillales bacterium]|nr:ABC transporter substrate-binding protein [Rhodospirillales bacterium]
MFRGKLIAAALTLPFALTSAQAVEMGDKDEPIKLAINEWTGQHIATHIAGETLKRAGYDVEYVTAGYDAQFTAIADGEIHGTMEVWSSNAPDLWIKMAEAGKVEDIGPTGIEAREGFLYPVHVKEMCPGLPDWEALKACAPLFATAETLPQGRLVDYPADWGTPGADRLTGLKLPYRAVPAGSEGALISELKASVAKKSPLLMVFWQPHWALSEYETEWVNLPKAEDGCFSDPAWGVNPDGLNDCDFSEARVFKVVWKGFDEKWPAAYEILQNISIPTADQQAMMGQIDQEGTDLEEVVAKWMDDHPDTWQAWIAPAQ